MEAADPTRIKELMEVHGAGYCHICGKLKIGPGSSICSYPHGIIPDEPVNKDHPAGLWSWKLPESPARIKELEGKT